MDEDSSLTDDGDAPEGSITAILHRFPETDPRSISLLWERCFPRLMEWCQDVFDQSHLDINAADDEDVALSAFESFVQRAMDGQFETLLDRSNLWRLISTIARRKALNHVRYLSAEKRDITRQSYHSVSQIADDRPSAMNAELLDTEARELLESLDDAELRLIIVLRLMGYSSAEIAEEISCSIRRIQRKIKLARILWNKKDVD
jgi:RNA polymerase sigma factor (sigma-70 family)